MTQRPAHARKVLTTKIPVRWGDMDAMGHVNNTIYFRYFEQARVEWLEALGYRGVAGVSPSPVLVHADCNFLKPVTYPAVCEVTVYAGEPGRSSVTSWYELRLVGDETLYATGSGKMVWVDAATGRSTPLPDDLRRALSGSPG